MTESPEEKQTDAGSPESANETDPGSTASRDGQSVVDETGRNPTQRRMDAEGAEPVPVDVPWGGDEQ